MPWWNWIVAGLALFVVEALTPGIFVWAFFGAASLAVAALTAAGLLPQVWQQAGSTALLAGLFIVLFRSRALAALTPRNVGGMDALVGTTCLVQRPMAAGERGSVELHGAAWSAVNVGPVPLAAGSRGLIEAREGLTLRIRAPQETPP